MSDKFKPGDLAVILSELPDWHGTVVKVLEKLPYLEGGYSVLVEMDGDEWKSSCHESQLEHVDVFNSPLYKLLD